MKKNKRVRGLLLTGLALIGVGTAQAADEPSLSCAQRYEKVLPEAKRLKPFEFDQSPAGWRQLTDCPAEAAKLIKVYLGPIEYVARNLHWHLAQTLAMAGDTDAAIQSALLSLNPPEEAAKHPGFNWNAYALATIEFLRGDKTAFKAQQQALRAFAAASASAENQNNIEVLDRLERCFGQPYKIAYVCPAVAP